MTWTRSRIYEHTDESLSSEGERTVETTITTALDRRRYTETKHCSSHCRCVYYALLYICVGAVACKLQKVTSHAHIAYKLMKM